MTHEDIRQWRTQNGYPQSAIAERAGIDQSYYAMIESGSRPLTNAVVEAVEVLEDERRERIASVTQCVNHAFGGDLETMLKRQIEYLEGRLKKVQAANRACESA